MLQEAQQKAASGVCDPVYERLIKEMMEDHKHERSALVFVNSFDYEKDTIEDLMTKKKVITEVFEIDRMQREQRLEYLNCFQKIYSTRELPMVFISGHLIGNTQALENHFNKML